MLGNYVMMSVIADLAQIVTAFFVILLYCKKGE